MKAIIKDSFSDAEKSSGCLLVTPKSFKYVKVWQGVEVSGLKYYVSKAVYLGASIPKPIKKVVKD